MTATLVLVLILVLLAAAVFYLPRLLTKRAIREVVLLFRERGATDATSASVLEELGLVQRGLFDRMFRMRDYRPQALRLLAQADIIRAAEGDRFYLSECALENSQVKKFAGIE